ncbi:MAG TPA: hypothetical protein VFT99_09495, partial [Roseiflexaceae bacterium]|nr:hypothetical protein [Roseiflexaceae bacterium]
IWSQVAGIPSSVTFNSVFLYSDTRAWAAGAENNQGVIYELQHTNNGWVAIRVGEFGAPLYELVVVSPDDIWAVGDNSLIVRGRPNAWQVMPVSPPNLSLRTIQVLGSNQAWAAGGRPAENQLAAVMLQYDGGAWSIDPNVSGDYQINSLHFAPGGGWAVGEHDLWRFRDGRWGREQAVEPCEPGLCAGGLASVRTLSGDEAWAVGTRSGFCAICIPRVYAVHRDGGNWQVVLPDQPIAGYPETPGYPSSSGLAGLYLSSASTGYAVGYWTDPSLPGWRPLVLRFQNGTWSYADTPAIAGHLYAISMTDDTHGLAVGDNGIVLAYGYGSQGGSVPTPPAGNPAARVPNPQQPGVLYFEQTGHSLRGAFDAYWRTYGGLAQFGYPITEEFRERNPDDGREYVVQYFERARFEYHPELAGTRYEVLLGLLGNTTTANRRAEAPFVRTGPNNRPGARYYDATGHNLAPEFVSRWDGTGGLAVYGYPISEAFYEVSPTDGKTYLVQYFERNRFEYHPENAHTYYEVLLGLLGSETLRARGWLP